MMEQMYVMIYNFMFTAAPPLAMGAYEKRLHENILSKTPKLYRYVSCKKIFIGTSPHFNLFSHKSQGRLGKGYRNQFWLVMLDSLWQSLVIFFITVKAYEGLDIGIWVFGATIVSSCLVTMLCHFALEVRTWVSVKSHSWQHPVLSASVFLSRRQ